MRFQTDAMSWALERGPPSRMVRSQISTAARMFGAVEFAFQPTFEGSPPVVDEHAHLLEHLPDPFDTDRQRTQRREDLGVVHLVARGVPGQDDDQCPADIEPRSPSPAAGLASTVGQVDRPGQPWVAQVGVVALVEPGEVSAGFEQSWLGPPDAGTDG